MPSDVFPKCQRSQIVFTGAEGKEKSTGTIRPRLPPPSKISEVLCSVYHAKSLFRLLITSWNSDLLNMKLFEKFGHLFHE